MSIPNVFDPLGTLDDLTLPSNFPFRDLVIDGEYNGMPLHKGAVLEPELPALTPPRWFVLPYRSEVFGAPYSLCIMRYVAGSRSVLTVYDDEGAPYGGFWIGMFVDGNERFVGDSYRNTHVAYSLNFNLNTSRAYQNNGSFQEYEIPVVGKTSPLLNRRNKMLFTSNVVFGAFMKRVLTIDEEREMIDYVVKRM